MPSVPSHRSKRFMRGALVWLVVLSCAAASAQMSAPAYVKNAQDPVQQYLSQAFLGFAFQKRCSELDQAAEQDYERRLNLANEIFKGYAIAKDFVAHERDAAAYSREMAMGAIRYSATQPCDASARDKVQTGRRVAADFVALIDPYMKQPLTK